MLKFIETITKDSLKGELYIWNVNRDSVDLFLSLAFRFINVKGFVVPDDSYCGESLFNKPIISISSLRKEGKSTLIFNDMAVSVLNVEIPTEVYTVQYSALLRCHPDLKTKNIYIYGDNDVTFDVRQWLSDNDIYLKGYCINGLEQDKVTNEQHIISYRPEYFGVEDAILVIEKDEEEKGQAMSDLADAPCDVYVDSIVPLAVRSCDNFALNLNRWLLEKRSIFLCSQYDLIADLVKCVCARCGWNLSGQVSIEANQQQGINDIYSLLYNGTDNSSVIINAPNDITRGNVLNELFDLGYSAEDDRLIGMQTYTYSDRYLCKEIYHVDDMLLWYSLADRMHDINGWQVIGEPDGADMKVIILGGSTSMEGVYWTESWSKKLYKKIRGMGTRVVMYLGVHPGQGVTGEFLRLVRDGQHIKPDVVISMSGANDTLNTLVNRFNPIMTNQGRAYSVYSSKTSSGIPNGEAPYDFWLRIENLMKFHVENQLQAKFFPFLQPLNMYMEKMNIEEKIQFESEIHREGCLNFYQNATDDDIYTNLISLFHHKANMYFDIAHYTDTANEIIADKVWKIISS